MPVIEQRAPGQGSVYPAVVESTTAQSQWLSYTSTTEQAWATTSTPEGWVTSYTTQTGWISSYTTTTDCNCEWPSSTPIIVTPTTTSVIPVQTTTPAGVIVVDHSQHGLSPGAVGGIVLGVFFGVLLLFLLCLCCFRNYRGRKYYASDSSSSSSSHSPRRKPPVVIIDPYPNRPEANLTFVGGGNYPGTRVMVTKTQKIFIRPPPVRQVRTVRQTRRAEKIVVVEEDD
ncbi:uncharacterized protein A1O5_03654 [Cladophialophora psammophila CBS 110553]|uniref:Uncharacterized protein n=1 Tax=Cladophialophora psammophila CBS 110553 TaxID=1182543 RepID=W9X0B2_9EURO|nr:uncharacterized protein A1O5_03654 [Cladophialophora psammophila CBS 110553]EXJ73892.1 hypothetical protein A1O5_03654 [Cladophialophora psammophila CBS 110553]